MVKIKRPTLVLDTEKARHNIKTMADKARKANVHFRPHFKTHQSHEIGRWFKELGVQSIATSSLEMADYFVKDGWQDVMVAVPVNFLQIDLINKLASLCKLHLVFDTIEVIDLLQNLLTHPVSAWVKVNTGYNRAGMDPFDLDLIVRSIENINQSGKINFEGLISHSGQSYEKRNLEDIEQIRIKEESYFSHLKANLRQRGISAKISIGDTPTCSYLTEFEGVDEIRPGNFVFYDMVQEQIGSCKEDQIATAIACPVIGKYENRNQILLYGGAVHLSKDSLSDENGNQVFAYAALATESGWGNVYKSFPITSVSQEVSKWIINADLFQQISLGDIIYLLPAHSCLTADLFDFYQTLDGKRIEKFRSNKVI